MRVVQERWNRITHTLVQVIDNRDGSFDAGGQAWITAMTTATTASTKRGRWP